MSKVCFHSSFVAAITRQIGFRRHISKSTLGPIKSRILSISYKIIVGLEYKKKENKENMYFNYLPFK